MLMGSWLCLPFKTISYRRGGFSRKYLPQAQNYTDQGRQTRCNLRTKEG